MSILYYTSFVKGRVNSMCRVHNSAAKCLLAFGLGMAASCLFPEGCGLFVTALLVIVLSVCLMKR